MQNNKQDKTPVHYEQKPDEDKPDYTTQRTYEPQSTNGRETSDRRSFLRRTGTAVVVGLGGILFGKTAMAEDIGNDGIDGVVGDNDENKKEGLRKVTKGYSASLDDCHPTCSPHCYPEACTPTKECRPYCEPNCDPNKECKPLFEDHHP